MILARLGKGTPKPLRSERRNPGDRDAINSSSGLLAPVFRVGGVALGLVLDYAEQRFGAPSALELAPLLLAGTSVLVGARLGLERHAAFSRQRSLCTPEEPANSRAANIAAQVMLYTGGWATGTVAAVSGNEIATHPHELRTLLLAGVLATTALRTEAATVGLGMDLPTIQPVLHDRLLHVGGPAGPSTNA